jgi:RES domain
MSCDIDAAAPDGPLHRVGRLPDAWVWPDWSHAGPDGTFGSRFDDPRGEYRVLYASSARRGAYVEVLARFRADPAVEAGLDEIEAEPGEDDEGPRPGQLPSEWLASHAVGTARADGAFAAVGSARSLAYLRDRLADRALHYGIDELDAAAIRRARPRAFTQELSRLVFECADHAGRPQFVGIAYRSRLGDEFENWAVFEPGGDDRRLSGQTSEPTEAEDPDFAAALELLGIELV